MLPQESPTAKRTVHTPTRRSAKKRLIALVGNPNSGKSTIFNYLTGLHQKVGNYPGVTVDCLLGRMTGQANVRILDLPGCYSLSPRSPDERLARDALLGWTPDIGRPDAVIVVVDASNLERNLFLASQVLDLHLPTIVVCNMTDVLEKRGDRLEASTLSWELGVPVVPTVGSTGRGLDQLRQVIASLPENDLARRDWWPRRRLPDVHGSVRDLVRRYDLADEAAADLMASLLLSPAVLNRDDASYFELPAPSREALQKIHSPYDSNLDLSPTLQVIRARYERLNEIVGRVLQPAETQKVSLSDRVDNIATHRVWGLGIFSLLMTLMFLAIFSWAGPLMNGIDAGMVLLRTGVGSLLGAGMLRDLLADGVIAGVGNVVVFFPQICILFLCIGLLEDSGYMARAAIVMDRVMRTVGLPGRSFIPLLSSFACAVPGILATRTIENRQDRLVTILVAPLMSCSARLPIYILMISMLFGSNSWLAAGIMFGMYALGLVTALLVAVVLKRTVLKGPPPMFMIEVPPYRIPRIGAALRHMWERSKSFLTEAGTIILTCSIILWALAYFPRAPQAVASDPGAQLRQSYIGRMGHVLEPVIAPLGFDWRIGVGLVSSFAAREVFVATMGVVYGLEKKADETSVSLRERMSASTWSDGRKVYTPLVGIAIMVFYVLACQCMSTLAVVQRETRSWRWPVFLFTYMTMLAYAGTFVVYQSGRLLGFA